jgi:hypothetical protein
MLQKWRGRTAAPATVGVSACRPGRSSDEGGRPFRLDLSQGRRASRRSAQVGAGAREAGVSGESAHGDRKVQELHGLSTHRIRMGNVRVWFLSQKKSANMTLPNM